jgi:23S rRNA (cytosine1962-C5)-methyltransferase
MTARAEVLIADDWRDYAVLDSGDQRKLERVGGYTFVRPEPQALWRPRLPASAWDNADAHFSASGDDEDAGRWRSARPIPSTWPMQWDGLRFTARMTPFRHLAVFPEHSVHWRFLAERLAAHAPHAPQAEVLNLFGYTGLASLVAARAGAKVTHVDASKKAIGFARENQAAAGLDAAPIRWIVDDALAFAQREVRRGRAYDAILVDPPKYGRGPNGEVWRLEENLASLLQACAALLRPNGALILTLYAVRLSAIAALQAVRDALPNGACSYGEMALPHADDDRLLPTALYVRWRGGEGAA